MFFSKNYLEDCDSKIQLVVIIKLSKLFILFELEFDNFDYFEMKTSLSITSSLKLVKTKDNGWARARVLSANLEKSSLLLGELAEVENEKYHDKQGLDHILREDAR